ncbi:MAG: hypothetical protein MHM6MM_002976 [Cercozoa sp. M6MM]
MSAEYHVDNVSLLQAARKEPGEIAALEDSELREFYLRQNETINELLGLLEDNDSNNSDSDQLFEAHSFEDAPLHSARQVSLAIRFSLYCNVLLFAAKLFASIWSLSLSMIASTLDSFLDLMSGAIIFVTHRIVLRSDRDPYLFPESRARFEPIGIVLFAVAMCFSSLQLVVQSVTVLSKGKETASDIDVDAVAIATFGATIVVKLILWLWCSRVARACNDNDSVRALADDHRNDVATNSFGLLAAYLTSKYPDSCWWLDASGAVALAVLMFVAWLGTAGSQVNLLAGKTAEPAFLRRIIWLAMYHDERVDKVDKVLAYHFGMRRYLVEVDIVLNEDLPLHITHDIGESLEQRIERQHDVQRCFVHNDFEFTHKPEHQEARRRLRLQLEFASKSSTRSKAGRPATPLNTPRTPHSGNNNADDDNSNGARTATVSTPRATRETELV